MRFWRLNDTSAKEHRNLLGLEIHEAANAKP
nr:MAG TPA: hypothetical protein [Caudoviricetes sp.]DAT43875.1 MAG TPA: hypothetical protein [Caudoviricetes sp.]